MTQYVSIDIETTGLDPVKANIIEFGAVLDDLSVQAPMDELPSFHAYILPPGSMMHAGDGKHYTGDPFALQMNAGILETIAKRDKRRDGRAATPAPGNGPMFLYPHQLKEHFTTWCEKHGLVDKVVAGGTMSQTVKFTPAGKNFAGFDKKFLDHWCHFDHLRIAHRVMDPAMLYLDPTQDSVPPSLPTCLERAGLDPDVPHTAIEDAKLVISLLRHAFPLGADE